MNLLKTIKVYKEIKPIENQMTLLQNACFLLKKMVNQWPLYMMVLVQLYSLKRSILKIEKIEHN